MTHAGLVSQTVATMASYSPHSAPSTVQLSTAALKMARLSTLKALQMQLDWIYYIMTTRESISHLTNSVMKKKIMTM